MNIYDQFKAFYGVDSTESKESPKQTFNANQKSGKSFMIPIELKKLEPNTPRYFRIQKFSPETQLRLAAGDSSVQANRVHYSTMWFKAVLKDDNDETVIKPRTHIFQTYAPLVVRPFTVKGYGDKVILEDTVIGGRVMSLGGGVLEIHPERGVSAVEAKFTDGSEFEVKLSKTQQQDLIPDPAFKGDKASLYISEQLKMLKEEYKETGDPSRLQMHNDFLTPKYFQRGTKEKPRPVTVDDPITMKDLFYLYNNKGVVVQAYEVAADTISGEAQVIKPRVLSDKEYEEAVESAKAKGEDPNNVSKFVLDLESVQGSLSVPLNNGALQLLNIRPSGDKKIFGDAGLYHLPDVGNSLYRIDNGVDLFVTKNVTKTKAGKDDISYTFNVRRTNSSIQGLNPIEALKTGFIDPFESFIEANDRSDLLIQSYNYHLGINQSAEDEIPFLPDDVDDEDYYNDSEEDSFADALD